MFPGASGHPLDVVLGVNPSQFLLRGFSGFDPQPFPLQGRVVQSFMDSPEPPRALDVRDLGQRAQVLRETPSNAEGQQEAR